MTATPIIQVAKRIATVEEHMIIGEGETQFRSQIPGEWTKESVDFFRVSGDHLSGFHGGDRNVLTFRKLRQGVKLVDQLTLEKIEDGVIVPKRRILIALKVVQHGKRLGESLTGTIINTKVKEFVVPGDRSVFETEILDEGSRKQGAEERSRCELGEIFRLRSESETFCNSGTKKSGVVGTMDWEKVAQIFETFSGRKLDIVELLGG
jgi:hypothetical protein